MFEMNGVCFQVPEGMDPIAAAPLMCAGVTVFTALRDNIEKAKPPAIVAVVGYESNEIFEPVPLTS